MLARLLLLPPPPFRVQNTRVRPWSSSARHCAHTTTTTMRFSALLVPTLLCASASAQYFSAGWVPGQAVSDEPPPAPAYTFDPSTPGSETPAPAAGAGQGIFDKILTSPVVSSLFGRFGVNITDAVARGAKSPWDDRIPLITDENYEEMIVNEWFKDEQEAKDRVWILIMCVSLLLVPLLSSVRTREGCVCAGRAVKLTISCDPAR